MKISISLFGKRCSGTLSGRHASTEKDRALWFFCPGPQRTNLNLQTGLRNRDFPTEDDNCWLVGPRLFLLIHSSYHLFFVSYLVHRFLCYQPCSISLFLIILISPSIFSLFCFSIFNSFSKLSPVPATRALSSEANARQLRKHF